VRGIGKMNLFEVKPIDERYYTEKIRDILPDRIVDIHTHIWTGDYSEKSNQGKRVVTWPSRVAAENPVEDLLETYRLLLPGKSVTPLVFNMPTKGEDLDRLNEYVKRSAEQYNLPSLMLTKPLWTGEVVLV